MKSTRIIFDNYHYILRAISLSKKYGSEIAKVICDTKSVGCPIPEGGFKNTSEYISWQIEIEKHDRTSHGYAMDILEAFKLDTKDDLLISRLCMMMFLGNKEPFTKGTIGYSANINEEKSEIHIGLTIYPWTTQSDLEGMELWKDIEILRKMLPSFNITKNKEWVTFERDLAVYEIYQKIQIENPNKKSVYQILLNDKRLAKLYESDNDANTFGIVGEQIYKIIKRCQKTFGNKFSTV